MKFLRIQLSQAGSFGGGGSGGSGVLTLTTDDSVVVPPTDGNINIAGDGTTTVTSGDAGTSTVTVSVKGGAFVESVSFLNVLYDINNGAPNYQFDFCNVNGTTGYNVGFGTAPSFTNNVGMNGYANTAIGSFSMFHSSTALFNTAIGYGSLYHLGGQGSANIAIGNSAGNSYTTTESNNILIGSVGVVGDSLITRIGATGSQSACYISGIDGVALTTATVVTEVSDQLGTAAIIGGTGITIDATSTPNEIIISLTPSSSRFKNDIAPVVSSEVMKLNPVSFNYKDNCNVSAQDKNVKHYGLIAEEVNDIMPELVTRDSNGAIQGVRYMNLIPLLLKEVQNLRKEIDDLKGK